jgi:peptidylprolyl isomerase
MRSFRIATAALLATTLGLGACGADDDAIDVTDRTTDTTAGSTDTSGTDPGTDASAEIEARGKPTVTVPDAPATELGITDDIVGAGDPVPEGSTVTVHYVGVGQQSGKQFDASWDRNEPATFPLSGVIAGWTQGIPGMKVGGRRTLVIPGELAYGASPPSTDIAPNETLVFVIDLISFVAPPPPPEPAVACDGTQPGPTSQGGADVLAEITARGKPTVTVPDAPATELCFIDEIVGAGEVVPAGATVTVHYVGVGQQSGKQFDASWDRNEPATFPLSGVIAGWTQGIPGMKVGGRRTLIIPGELAYGASSPTPDIAANETLVFTIDLISIG